MGTRVMVRNYLDHGVIILGDREYTFFAGQGQIIRDALDSIAQYARDGEIPDKRVWKAAELLELFCSSSRPSDGQRVDTFADALKKLVVISKTATIRQDAFRSVMYDLDEMRDVILSADKREQIERGDMDDIETLDFFLFLEPDWSSLCTHQELYELWMLIQQMGSKEESESAGTAKKQR